MGQSGGIVQVVLGSDDFSGSFHQLKKKKMCDDSLHSESTGMTGTDVLLMNTKCLHIFEAIND